MRKPVEIIILCEDPQQECFIRRFLMNRGWRRDKVRVERPRQGAGSAEQWVRERFPTELRAYRSRCNHLKSGLIAVIDADTMAVAGRARGFDRACEDQGVALRGRDERVLFVVPKRNIETWLAYLRGEQVDEQATYRKYDCQSRCQADVDSLDQMCKRDELDGTPPPSLERCCKEFRAFWSLIK